MVLIRDRFGRVVNYLRISVTDRCNLRCRYCMPAEGVAWRSHEEILSYEEITAVVRAGITRGYQKFRVTGGEPLVRRGIESLIHALAHEPGVLDLGLTTNGTLLAEHSQSLWRAGLRRLNVSLDTLRPHRFLQLTGRDLHGRVLEGIDKALALGFSPLKVNVVAQRGINDDEVLDFVAWTRTAPIEVRFIEFMPFPGNTWDPSRVVSVGELRTRIAEHFPLEATGQASGRGPARVHRVTGHAGRVGFISPMSESFCHRCNRIRLTAEGRLKACLLHPGEVDVRGPLRRGASLEELARCFHQVLELRSNRPPDSSDHGQRAGRMMCQVGG
jgi:cyclic pyranopterin phosphate synthase